MFLVPLVTAVAAQAAPAAPLLIPGGTIGIARTPAAAGRPASPDPATTEAVEGALADAGFTVIPSAQNARHVATIALTRYAKGAAIAKGASRNPVLPTMGMGGGAGAGVSIALGGGKPNVGTMVETQLTMTIARRGESTPVWEGKAVTYSVTGTRADEPQTVARKLAAALTRNFSAPSGLSISVP